MKACSLHTRLLIHSIPREPSLMHSFLKLPGPPTMLLCQIRHCLLSVMKCQVDLVSRSCRYQIAHSPARRREVTITQGISMHVVKHCDALTSQTISPAGIFTLEPLGPCHIPYHSWLAFNVGIGKGPWGLIYACKCPFLPSLLHSQES